MKLFYLTGHIQYFLLFETYLKVSNCHWSLQWSEAYSNVFFCCQLPVSPTSDRYYVPTLQWDGVDYKVIIYINSGWMKSAQNIECDTIVSLFQHCTPWTFLLFQTYCRIRDILYRVGTENVILTRKSATRHVFSISIAQTCLQLHKRVFMKGLWNISNLINWRVAIKSSHFTPK